MGEHETPQRPRVLIFEPDEALRRALDAWLTEEGLAVTSFAAPGDAVEVAGKYQPDGVILNVGKQADLHLLVEIKQRYGLPSIVITHDSSDGMRIEALEKGADDFLLMPFDWDAVSSRMRFLLGKQEEGTGAVLMLTAGRNKIEIDYRRRVLKRNGRAVVLSRTEWVLLRELTEWPGEPRFDGELLVKAFGAEYRHDSAYLRMWIARLREKLGDDVRKPRLIRRYHGAGYILAVDMAEEETAAS